MFAIIGGTWMEILRKRVLLVTVLLSLVTLGLFFAFVHLQQSAGNGSNALGAYANSTLAVVVGLYLTHLTVAFLSIFSAAGAISSEIESGLLLAILPRPIPRWQVYLGKWVGYVVWSLLYSAILYWTVIAIVHLQLTYPLHWAELIRAFGMFELIPLVLVSVTMAGSLYLPSLGNGIAMTLLFMVGVMGGFLGRLTLNPTSGDNKVVLISNLIIPTDAAYHRMVFALMGGSIMPQTPALGPFSAQGIVPSMRLIAYTGLYILAFVALGIFFFSHKDV